MPPMSYKRASLQMTKCHPEMLSQTAFTRHSICVWYRSVLKPRTCHLDPRKIGTTSYKKFHPVCKISSWQTTVFESPVTVRLLWGCQLSHKRIHLVCRILLSDDLLIALLTLHGDRCAFYRWKKRICLRTRLDVPDVSFQLPSTCTEGSKLVSQVATTFTPQDFTLFI
jgi:hypothetical protein